MKKRNNTKKKLLVTGICVFVIGFAILLFPPLEKVKKQVFNDMRLAIYRYQINQDNIYMNQDVTTLPSDSSTDSSMKEDTTFLYIGQLEIPAISLKRGFVEKYSIYNNINYNIQIAKEADYPDVIDGNFILMAHSGDAAISFFDSLYQLKLGDEAIVSYQANTYYYQLVKTYTVEKTGKVAIYRDYHKKTLTLITCTRNDDSHQSIYIFEQKA